MKTLKKAQNGTSNRGKVAVGGNLKLDDKPKAKYKPTAKEAKNLKDATEMKNMRPTAPSTGRVKTTMGGAKNGKTIKKEGMHKMPDGSIMKNSKMKSGGKMSKCKYGCN